jgi:hypothetical protein
MEATVENTMQHEVSSPVTPAAAPVDIDRKPKSIKKNSKIKTKRKNGFSLIS